MLAILRGGRGRAAAFANQGPPHRLACACHTPEGWGRPFRGLRTALLLLLHTERDGTPQHGAITRFYNVIRAGHGHPALWAPPAGPRCSKVSNRMHKFTHTPMHAHTSRLPNRYASHGVDAGT
eukprot:1149337-Pelagomonas_calceolata.AAC.3